MKILMRLFLIGMLISSNLWSEKNPITWYNIDSNKKATIQVELFLSSTCPHCHKAELFFKTIEPSTPWLRIHRHLINEDKNALILFSELLTQYGFQDFSVPSIFFCDSRWNGFATAETTGNDLVRALNYCKQDIEKQGKLTQNTTNLLRQKANSNKILQTKRSSVFETALLSAVINLAYTCSIFCLMTFLSILFLQGKRTNQLQLGLLFIITIGFMHFFQQRYMAVYFDMLPWMRIPAALIGLLSIQAARVYYNTLSIISLGSADNCVSTRTKPPKLGFGMNGQQILSYLMTFLLALMIGLYQQSCSSNWFYLFEQLLNHQHLNRVQTAFYEVIYHTAFVLPLLLVLIIYLLVMNAKRFEEFNNRLKTIGIVFFATIGLILIIYPLALSSMYLSFLVVILLPVCAWLLNKFNRREKRR